jgi:hypothetical protein
MILEDKFHIKHKITLKNAAQMDPISRLCFCGSRRVSQERRFYDSDVQETTNKDNMTKTKITHLKTLKNILRAIKKSQLRSCYRSVAQIEAQTPLGSSRDRPVAQAAITHTIETNVRSALNFLPCLLSRYIGVTLFAAQKHLITRRSRRPRVLSITEGSISSDNINAD